MKIRKIRKIGALVVLFTLFPIVALLSSLSYAFIEFYDQLKRYFLEGCDIFDKATSGESK